MDIKILTKGYEPGIYNLINQTRHFVFFVFFPVPLEIQAGVYFASKEALAFPYIDHLRKMGGRAPRLIPRPVLFTITPCTMHPVY